MATEARVTAIIQAKDEASKVLDTVSTSFGVFNSKILGIVGALGVAGGAMAKVANDTEEFNRMIARAGANVGAGADQLAQFRKIAVEASRDSYYNATQAAGALYQLAGGSIDANDAMAALGQTVKFATAAGMDDLDEAAITVANVMTLFKLRGEEAARAMDVLTVAGQSAFGTTAELVDAFKEAGPIASQVGISIEDLTALLSALAETGTRGTEAGVALKRAISELVNPSKQMTEALGELGISVQDLQATINDPIKMLGLLNDALVDIQDPIERASVLSRIFGDISGPAMAALLSQGIDSLQDYKDAMDDSAGATDRAAAAAQEALNPIDQLKQRFFELEVFVQPVINKTLQGFVILADSIPFALKQVENLAAGYLKATDAIQKFGSAITSVKSKAESGLQSIGQNIGAGLNSLLSFDKGGIVPGPIGSPMLAVVHGGETVVPTRGGSASSFGNGITVNISGNNISSDMDMRKIAERVSAEIMRTLRSVQQI